MNRQPVICCLDRDPTDADARRLTPGSRVAHLTDDLSGAPGTLVGSVADGGLCPVIQAAQRGWHLVVRLDVTGEQRRLALEDLARMGHLCGAEALGGKPFLDPIDADLLRHLAAGATVQEAAATVGVSDRTAARRLAILRDALGVATTAGVVARWSD